MEILKQNKVRLENDVSTRNNPASILGIYLTAAKVVHCRLVDKNR